MVSISASATVETTYRTSAALRRDNARSPAVSTPISAPCQRNCRSAHPSAWTIGCRNVSSISIIMRLPPCFDQLPNLAELLGRGPPGVERLHHQLRRGPAERAIEQIAHQLPLGLLLAEPVGVDVGAVGVVTPHQPLLRHDLEQLERGGVGGLTDPHHEHLVDLTNRTGAAFPQHPENRQLRVGRPRRRGVFRHGAYYLRIPSYVSTKTFVHEEESLPWVKAGRHIMRGSSVQGSVHP